LQEWLQARKMELPNYELVEVSGKDHKQRFSVTCTVVEKSAASTGESTTRRKAEQKAARKMMEILSENEQ
jgi:ribonuclease III